MRFKKDLAEYEAQVQAYKVQYHCARCGFRISNLNRIRG